MTASPYPPKFTFVTVPMPPDTVKLTADQLRSPGGAKVWEEHGYVFQGTERIHPDRPHDWFFNPTFFILTNPGGEPHKYSPEAVEIKNRLFDALSWAGPDYKNRRAWKQWSPIHSEIADWFWTTSPGSEVEFKRTSPGAHAERIAEKLAEIAARPETVKANREGLLRAAQVVAQRLPASAAKGPRVMIPSPPWKPEMAGEQEAEELEDEIRMVAATWLDKMANDQAAEAWSTSNDQIEEDLERMGYEPQPWIEAAFDYSVAVNGELVDKQMNPPEGYGLTDRGGEIPSVEEQVDFTSLAAITRDEASKKLQRALPLELVERILVREYGSRAAIPVSVSGEADIYAQPKEEEGA